MTDEMPRAKTIEDERIIGEFQNSPGPVDTAPDLAERLPLTADAIRRRLRDMEEEGRVKSRTVGSRAVVWWVNRQ